eukprot:14175267-Heterocapsa_arctica.AAC.1
MRTSNVHLFRMHHAGLGAPSFGRLAFQPPTEAYLSWRRAGRTVEVDEPDPGPFTREDLLDWVGGQAPALQAAWDSDSTLTFVEVYTNTAAAAEEVEKAGGRVLRLGLAWGQDFSRARDCALSLFLLVQFIVGHLWISFPCTVFCAWVSINLARGGD